MFSNYSKVATKTFEKDGLYNEMNLYIRGDEMAGFIEWYFEEDEENDDIIKIDLHWDDNYRILDYGGVEKIPKEAIDLLIDKGFDLINLDPDDIDSSK